MRIVVEAQADQARLRAALRYMTRGWVRAYRVIATVALVGGGALFVDQPDVTSALLIVIGVLGWVLPEVGLRRAVRRHLAAASTARSTYEITHDGVRVVGSNDEADLDLHLRWSAFQAVHELPDQLVLDLGRRDFLSVPTVDLSTDERAELTGVLVERGLLPARPERT